MILKRIFQKIRTKFFPSRHEKLVKKWYEDDGENKHRLTYDLNESSLVIDLGGYKGQWASDIFAKYLCEIHVFEPIKSFAEKITSRFLKNSKIHTHQFGLGSKTRTDKIKPFG